MRTGLFRPLIFFPLAALLSFSPFQAKKSPTVDSFHHVTGNKPLQDTTVAIVVTSGMSYRKLAKEAILEANRRLYAGDFNSLSLKVNADLINGVPPFQKEYDWVTTLAKRYSDKKLLEKGHPPTVTVTVPKEMLLSSSATVPAKTYAPPTTAPAKPAAAKPVAAPPPAPKTYSATSNPLPSDVKTVLALQQQLEEPTGDEELMKRYTIFPEVFLSYANTTGLNKNEWTWKSQALWDNVMQTGSLWKALWLDYDEVTYSEDYKPTAEAKDFAKEVMGEERKLQARRVLGAPMNALDWRYADNPTFYSTNASRLSYTQDELRQVLDNTIRLFPKELSIKGQRIYVSKTVDGKTYKTSLTLDQFYRWVKRETDNCPFWVGAKGEKSLIHIMDYNVQKAICRDSKSNAVLDPLVPEYGLYVALCYGALVNAEDGNNGNAMNNHTFTVFNGGPRYFNHPTDRKNLALDYGREVGGEK